MVLYLRVGHVDEVGPSLSPGKAGPAFGGRNGSSLHNGARREGPHPARRGTGAGLSEKLARTPGRTDGRTAVKSMTAGMTNASLQPENHNTTLQQKGEKGEWGSRVWASKARSRPPGVSNTTLAQRVFYKCTGNNQKCVHKFSFSRID